MDIRWRPGALIALAGLAFACSTSGAQEIAWQTDVDTAWRTAVKYRRPLLLYITTPSCGYCELMHQRTLSDAGVAARVNSDFVPVVVNASSAASLMQRLGVRVYPTTVVVSPENTVMDKAEGFLPADGFRERLATLIEERNITSKR